MELFFLSLKSKVLKVLMKRISFLKLTLIAKKSGKVFNSFRLNTLKHTLKKIKTMSMISMKYEY